MKTKRQMRLEKCQLGRTRQANCQLRRTKSQPGLRCCSSEREAELGSEKRR